MSDVRDFELGTCAACGTVAIPAEQGWWVHRDTAPCPLRQAGFSRAHFLSDQGEA